MAGFGYGVSFTPGANEAACPRTIRGSRNRPTPRANKCLPLNSDLRHGRIGPFCHRRGPSCRV